jgi:hypothetical protein
MTKLDATAEMTLEHAHGAREPSAADRARNLAAIRARLAVVPRTPGASVGPAGAVNRGALAHAAGLWSEAARSLEVAAPPARSVWPRVLSAAVFSGVVGFFIGSNMGHALSERAPGVSAAPSAAAAARDSAAHVAAPDSAVRAQPLALVEGSSKAQPPVARGSKVPAKSRASKATEASAVRAHPAESSAGFLDAVRLLRRAQRAVRMGDVAVGSSLLDQLDEGFSNDVLREERQATRVLCWCGSGDVERAQALARDLLAQNPRSIYARRMHQSCAGSSLDPTVAAPLAPARP